MAKIFRYSVLLLPILFFWAGNNMHKAKYANDPEYIYLVNATAICDGKFVGHIDNPGTTVMQLGAATIAIKHIFSNPDNQTLVNHVFSEPDQFVSAIRFLFLILNTLVLFFLGWFAIKKTGSVWVALLLQLATFITSNTLDHVWTKMSPEPVLFLVSCIYIIAILFFYAEKDKNQWKYVLVFALISGAGLGTKATFLPLVIFPFVAIPTFKKKIAYSFGIIPSFVLFTIPAIPEYESMYWWFRGLIGHTGKYGHGKAGLVDTETYLPNLVKIAENNPLFFAAFLFGISVLIFALFKWNKIKQRSGSDIRFLGGLLATMGFGYLLVAKHYHHNHYLIPVLLLTGITLFFSLKIIFYSELKRGINALVLPALVILLAVFVAWKQPPAMKYASEGYLLTNEEMEKTNTLLNEKYSDYTRVYFYPFSFYRESALNFGDVYTKRKMLPYLKKLYPNTYFFDFYENKIRYWNADISPEELVEFNGSKILFLGNRKGNNVPEVFAKSGIPLNEIYKGRVEAIYELDSARFASKQKPKTILNETFFDAETVTPDQQFFTDSTANNFGQAFMRSTDFARSGKYSVKLDKNTEFALDYKIGNLTAGDKYEIDIWRKADNASGRLVVAGSNHSFYSAQNDFITSDKKGWDLIRIKFTVSPKMENETLKVYLWNPKKKVAYFDDLSVRKIE